MKSIISPVSFKEYETLFPYSQDKIYELIFERNRDLIKLKKKSVAVMNLKNIFTATFAISSKIGFHEMSLRDLSQTANISMGSIYLCISKKEDIAIMVKNLIEEMSALHFQMGRKYSKMSEVLESTIRLHFYHSCILQPWLFFIFFETRSLSKEHQQQSKQIELQTIENYHNIIKSGIDSNEFECKQPAFLAHTIVVLIQDWYLKPWKRKPLASEREKYLSQILLLSNQMLKIR